MHFFYGQSEKGLRREPHPSQENAIPTGGGGVPPPIYDLRITNYDLDVSALRAFLRSESKTEFSRMRAVTPSGVDACRIRRTREDMPPRANTSGRR